MKVAAIQAAPVFLDRTATLDKVLALMPTHGERMVWSQGDGHGLRVHKHAGFKIGGLNAVLEKRQNFDPAGHYSRKDVFRLDIDKDRP